MAFIKKNLKTIGGFCTILIVFSIIFLAKNLFTEGGYIFNKISDVGFIIGLICGLIYAFSGYKKNAAKYYKVFMIAYALTSVYAVIAKCIADGIFGTSLVMVLTTIINVIAAICVIILALAKDLGEKRALTLAQINFVLTLVSTILGMVFINAYLESLVFLPIVMLSIIAFIFVVAKYVDKESRGTKSNG